MQDSHITQTTGKADAVSDLPQVALAGPHRESLQIAVVQNSLLFIYYDKDFILIHLFITIYA